MKFTRDSAMLWLPILGGIAGYLSAHFNLLQHAFPGLVVDVWQSRIELVSGLVAMLGAYLRMSPLALSENSDLASRDHDQTLTATGKVPSVLVAIVLSGAVLFSASACAVHKQPPAGTYTTAGLNAFNADQMLKDLQAISQTAINLNAATGREHLSDRDTMLVRDFALSAGAALQSYGTGGSTLQQVRDAYGELMKHLSVDGSQHPQLAGALVAIGVALNQVQQ